MNQEFIKELSSQLPDLEIKKDELMSGHTTFRVGGPADIFVSPNKEELDMVLKIAKAHKIPITIIGNGSNLLVTDKGIRGLVVEIGKAMETINITDTTITVGAGTLMSKTANAAADASLGGMEFAAGIPGSIGGAVVMNAGAYGGEIKDIIVSAEVITPEGNKLTLKAEELDLSYRHSCIIDKGYIVTAATFKLKKKPQEEIRELMAELRDKRVDKQPLEFPSAGSTFKRPEGYFAGKLIQDAGLRGYTVGGAQVSEKHCGFVINKGGATASDIMQLIKDVQAKVMEDAGVYLETEVKLLGE